MSCSTIFCAKWSEGAYLDRRVYVLLVAILLVFACTGLHTRSAHAAARFFVLSSVDPVNINIIEANAGGQNFQVGQQIDWVLSVQETVKPVTSAYPVTVIDMLPKGLVSLSSSGAHWRIMLSAFTSPATLTATYDGPYPLLPGVTLPPITVSGIFTPAAVPIVANSVLLEMSDVSCVLSPVSTHTVHVVASMLLSTRSASMQLKTPTYPRTYLTPLPDDTFYPNLPHSGY